MNVDVIIRDTMVTVPINIRDDLSVAEAQTLLAIKLLEMKRISLGKAAEIAGFSKPAFIEVLDKYDVPVISYTAKDLADELHL